MSLFLWYTLNPETPRVDASLINPTVVSTETYINGDKNFTLISPNIQFSYPQLQHRMIDPLSHSPSKEKSRLVPLNYHCNL